MTDEEQLLNLESQFRELDAPHAADIIKLIRLWRNLDRQAKNFYFSVGCITGVTIGFILGSAIALMS